MMKMRQGVLLVVCLLLCAGSASAAGFALIEQSVKGLGSAYSGGAAVAEDASTIFFNPAGMTRLDTQATAGFHVIVPSAKFQRTAATLPVAMGGAVQTGGSDGGQGSVSKVVPNFYFVAEAGPNCRYGVGVNTPFGLATKYPETWVGRYHGIESDIMTVNINPSAAYKLGDLSIGVGVSAQYINALLSQEAVLGPGTSSFTQVKGDAWGYGYNAGILYEVSEDTRFGASFRSSVLQNLEGNMYIRLTNASLPISGKIRLPASAQASLFHRVTPAFDLMADVMWTDWSSFDRLVINTPLGPNITDERWRDNLRYSLGTAFHASDALTLRAGFAFDETPIPDNYRTPRIPGNDRTWVSVGAGYSTGALQLDFAYAHLFVKDGTLNLVDTTGTRGNVSGSFNNQVDIASAEVTYKF